ncbi:hypothetical protein PsorP6_012634 [Peronosclerospora sorghi]|uniref:Uncharacterized protein n=1 Tax=Peronosclerospora sorghi TaxID=230839 RepID=A0ACC0WG95_9STRA|nr:hypothetical protein PsorP6_012634 [Peronosclerospora sorghi]
MVADLILLLHRYGPLVAAATRDGFENADAADTVITGNHIVQEERAGLRPNPIFEETVNRSAHMIPKIKHLPHYIIISVHMSGTILQIDSSMMKDSGVKSLDGYELMDWNLKIC